MPVNQRAAPQPGESETRPLVIAFNGCGCVVWYPGPGITYIPPRGDSFYCQCCRSYTQVAAVQQAPDATIWTRHEPRH